MSPDEIRALRKRLGLSQVEAGELLGGGPRAFAKYEAGSLRPAASLVTALRLLEAEPALLASLRGNPSPPSSAVDDLPFEVAAQHVASLTERTLPELLRKLLSAEVQAFGLPAHGIHVASAVTTPDGGEDARIRWSGGPSDTEFLTWRFTQFQLKSGPIGPKQAGGEVLTTRGEVKPMVRSALRNGAHYVLLCAHRYNQKEIARRVAAIRDALRGAGMQIDDEQVWFRAAEWIASWVNRYPSVAVWVKQQTQPGTIGPFRSWSHWAARPEHDDSPWVDDERLPHLRELVRARAARPRRVVRVVGPLGIGKSRLVLEALAPSPDDEALGSSLSDLVVYADEFEAERGAIAGVVQVLAESRQRAVVVVDRCPPDLHQILVGSGLRAEGRLSLITLDDELPTPLEDLPVVEVSEHETVLRVPEAPPAVTEGIISRVSPRLAHEDARRLAGLSVGFPKVAQLVVQAWARDRPIAHATDDSFVATFLLGRTPRESDLILKSGRLLAAFALVGVDDPDGKQLAEVAAWGRGVTDDDLRAAFNDLLDRGVARRRGASVTLQPRPIAMRLAEGQWREWSRSGWDEVLAGEPPPGVTADVAQRLALLKVSAAKQLARLNTTPIAQEVVRHVCRHGGPFDGLEGLCTAPRGEVLSALAEVEPGVVVGQLERSLEDVPDLFIVDGVARRHLVWTLEKIAFDPECFEAGARLLLRLAVAENESCSNNATGQFKALFPLVLGSTAADGPARLSVLTEVVRTEDPRQRALVVGALVDATAIGHFGRSAGAETHGSRRSYRSWRPASRAEAHAYLRDSLTLLTEMAAGADPAGQAARTGLGQNLRALAARGFIDLVEVVVREVGPQHDFWPEALESLGQFLRYDAGKVGPETVSSLRTLQAELSPRGPEARVGFFVTDMPWDYLADEIPDHELRHQRHLEEVRRFAEELLAEPDRLRQLLPQMCRRAEASPGRSGQRMTAHLGHVIAESSDSALEWLEPILDALRGVPRAERDFDLLSGYVVGLSPAFSNSVEAFKREASESSDFALALPLVCWRLGVADSDIPIVVAAFRSGRLPPWTLMQWTMGGVLAEVRPHVVAPLFDALLDDGVRAFGVAVDLMGMYSFGARDTLEELRPQLRKCAEKLVELASSELHRLQGHHFTELMMWILAKGRQDRDACAVALTLATALVRLAHDHAERFLEPLLHDLIRGFPDIAWPIIGGAITSDQQLAWRLEYVLGSLSRSAGRQNAAILELTEDALFAWCHAHPETAPAFVGSVAPVLTSYDGDGRDRALHPTMARLLDEFGAREDVLAAVGVNLRSYSGWGSPSSHYALYAGVLASLRDDHRLPQVQRWAAKVSRDLPALGAGFDREDDEWRARREL